MSAYQNTPYRVLCQIAINSRSDPGITFDDFYQAALRDQDREIVASRNDLAQVTAEYIDMIPVIEEPSGA